MTINVSFYSYFKDLTGVAWTMEQLPEGATLGELHLQLIEHFPRLGAMKNSTLLAVGVEYQPRDHQLKEGDEVALFPPVQGG